MSLPWLQDTWNAKRLSAVLGKRTIAFVGDSIQVQQFFSLKNMMSPAISTLNDPSPDWFHFNTVDGGTFMMEGTQFL